MKRIGEVASLLNQAAERVRLAHVHGHTSYGFQLEHLKVSKYFGCHALESAAFSAYGRYQYRAGAMKLFRKAALDFDGITERSIYPWWPIEDRRRLLALKAAALTAVSEAV